MIAVFVTLALTLVLGTTLRLAQGRVRTPRASSSGMPHAADLRSMGLDPGDGGTVVEVTTAQCSDCESTYRILVDAAAGRSGVAVHQLSAEQFPAVLKTWNVLQAPTTFFFDPKGNLVARVGGRATRRGIETALEGLV